MRSAAVDVRALARLLALALACVLAAGAAPARAAEADALAPADARFPVGGPAMVAAWELAEQHWGTAPCAGRVELLWTALDELTNATATWRNPSDAWNNAAANFDCRIAFSTRAEFDWPKLCSVMTHEVGHLLGHQHADVPWDVMAAIYSEPLAVCADTPEPGVAPPPPAPVPAPGLQATVDATRVTATRRPSRAVQRRARTARRRAAACTARSGQARLRLRKSRASGSRCGRPGRARLRGAAARRGH